MAFHAAWDFAVTNIFALGGATGGEAAIFSVPLHSLTGTEETLYHFLGLAGKVICLVLVVLWVYWREGRLGIKADIAQPTLRVEEGHHPPQPHEFSIKSS
jgi:hypothetical protein